MFALLGKSFTASVQSLTSWNWTVQVPRAPVPPSSVQSCHSAQTTSAGCGFPDVMGSEPAEGKGKKPSSPRVSLCGAAEPLLRQIWGVHACEQQEAHMQETRGGIRMGPICVTSI